jgi:hypothetical protein
LLDYYEGRLSPEKVEALKQFALEHPELEITFDDDPLDITLPANDTSPAFDFESLKVPEDLDDLIIKQIEGLATKDELSRLQKLSRHKAVDREIQLYQLTKIPVETTFYPFKKDLYKKERKTLLYWSRYAAIFILLTLLLSWLFSKKDKQYLPQQKTFSIYSPPQEKQEEPLFLYKTPIKKISKKPLTPKKVLSKKTLSVSSSLALTNKTKDVTSDTASTPSAAQKDVLNDPQIVLTETTPADTLVFVADNPMEVVYVAKPQKKRLFRNVIKNWWENGKAIVNGEKELDPLALNIGKFGIEKK